MNAIWIIGGGEHARVVMDIALCAGVHIIGVIDDGKAVGTPVGNSQVLGNLAALPSLCQAHGCSHGVVAIGNNAIRAKVVGDICSLLSSFSFVSLVHPSAVVAQGVVLGVGSVVMAGAVLNPGCVVGEHAIVNTRAGLDHDNQIGKFASVAPGVTLGGCVRVGAYSAVGLGANVIHGIRIGEHVVVGAGALVNKNVRDRVVVYGVPAREVRNRLPGDRYL